MNIQNYKRIINETKKYSQEARILAVTKYSDIIEINKAIETWILMIWENRIEAAEEKFDKLSANIEKHYIWVVQTKKLRKIFNLFDIIESIWNIKQLIKINQIAESEWGIAKIYLQFNISNEKQKSWFHKEEISEIINISKDLKFLNILWIMWMSSNWTEKEVRNEFKSAKKIFEDLKSEITSIKELSIWMSNDYKIALEEWATIVRIWSALFK